MTVNIDTNLVARYYEADDELYGPTIERVEKAEALRRKADGAGAADQAVRARATEAREAIGARVHQLIVAGDDPDGHPDIAKLRAAADKADQAVRAREDESPSRQLEAAARAARFDARMAPEGFDATAAMRRHVGELKQDAAAMEEAFAALSAAKARVEDRINLLAAACAAHPNTVTRSDLASQARVASANLTIDRVVKNEGRLAGLSWIDQLDDGGVYHDPQVEGLPPRPAFTRLAYDAPPYSNERPSRRRDAGPRRRSEVMTAAR